MSIANSLHLSYRKRALEEIIARCLIHAQFDTYSPDGWQGLARDYHMVFDGILKTVYSDREFEQYLYDDYRNYNDSWNDKGFYVYE